MKVCAIFMCRSLFPYIEQKKSITYKLKSKIMRKTIYFIGIFLAMLACSKNDNEGQIATIEENSLESRLLKAISDTTGLKMFGAGNAYSHSDTLLCILGTKYDKLWCGFFSGNDSIGFKEEFVYVSPENMQTSWEIDAGYGETETITLPIDGGLGAISIRCSLLDKNKLAIASYFPTRASYLPCTIIVNQSEVLYKDIYIGNIWYDGYYQGTAGGNNYVFDLNGNSVFIPQTIAIYDAIPISLYECLSVNCDGFTPRITIARIDVSKAEPESTLWSYELAIGKVINNNAPRISYTRSLDGNILTLEASATNYDGTQETGFFQIDINTEEIIANDGFTINQAQ